MQQKRTVSVEMEQKRAAYTAFEKTVLDLYDQGRLTLDQLDCIASQYHWLNVDSAGSQQMLTRDGKELCQVCITLVDPAFPIPSRGSSKDHEEYWEQEFKKWEDIVRWRWGWHAYNAISPNASARDKIT